MLDINERLSKLESLELEVEDAVAKKEFLEQQGTELLNALQELSDDMEIAGVVKEYDNENRENLQENNAVLDGFREEVQRIENELTEFIELTNSSIEKIQELADLDIDVTESLIVLNERKKLIEECTKELESLIKKLNMAQFTGQIKEGEDAGITVDEAQKHNPKFKPIVGGGNNDSSWNNSSPGNNPPGNDKPPNSDLFFGKACIHGTVPKGYLDNLWSRYDNGEDNVKRLFDNLSDMVEIQDTKHDPKSASYYLSESYQGFQRGIYLDTVNDAANSKRKGTGTTFWHEAGHMLDHASKGFYGWASHNYFFSTALYNDARHILNEYRQMPEKEKTEFLEYLYTGAGHSLSDLLDGLTAGEISGFWGHDRAEWNKPGTIEKEAFAHFFEASMGGGKKLAELKRVFPESFTVFNQIVDNINSSFDKLTLRKILKK